MIWIIAIGFFIVNAAISVYHFRSILRVALVIDLAFSTLFLLLMKIFS